LVVALVIGFLAILSYYHSIEEAEHLAQHEAESIARTIAFEISLHTHPEPPLCPEGCSELQELIIQFRDVQKRDIIITDIAQNIIADAFPEEIGTVFKHDVNDEVGQTIKDSRIRTFTETSDAYPEGIRFLVIPLDTEDGVRIGALILEFTPLYDEIIETERDHAKQFMINFAIALIIASLVGYVMSRQISAPLREMENAALRISKGDHAAKVMHESDDELGTLAKSLNTMIIDINTARDDLLKANTELELEVEERSKAQEHLTLSEQKYRNLFESATDGIFILDLKGNIIDVNNAAYERLGYPKDELLSMHIKQLDPPEFADKVPERMAKIREKGSAVFESAQIKKDGTVMPVEVNAKLLEHEGRQVFFSVVRDITERKEAERQLRESEERFRGAFESVGVGASMASLKGYFTKANRSLCEMLGYKEEELLSKTFSDVTHPDDVQIGLDAVKKLVSGELINTVFEKRYIRKDGQLINVVISPAIVRDSDGNPIHFMALFQDITERKRAEEALIESEMKFRTLADKSPTMIFIIKMGKIVYANMKCEEVMGYSLNEMCSPDFNYLDLIVPEHVDTVKSNTIKHFKGEEVPPYEYTVVTKGGRRIESIITTKLIQFEGERAILGIVTDITEQKKTEEKIKRSLKEKEVLLKEIHHRVKNNMAIISSLLQLQARYSKDEKITQLFRDSQSRISSMALVHEKLYQTKDFSNINFREYVEELVSHLLDTYGMKEGDINLLLSVGDINLNIDTIIPCGLILNELVTNSLKYAFEGVERPEISISFDKHDGQATLIYSDNGIGMPEHIDFPSSESLGLQIVSMLALQLRGTAELKRDVGTEFVIRLELAEGAQD
jgi:PAS domain S-box-containing protein